MSEPVIYDKASPASAACGEMWEALCKNHPHDTLNVVLPLGDLRSVFFDGYERGWSDCEKNMKSIEP